MSATVVVVNQRSAGGKTEARWPALRLLALEHFGPVEERFTRGPDDATRLTREALAAGAGTIVAVGGDGTINEVVNGFFDDGGAVNPEAALAILPAGTGGDFIKSVDVPLDPERAAQALNWVPRPIDIGRLRYTREDGAEATRYFINIASFGISGLVDRNVHRASKALGGKLSFAVATLKAGAVYRNAEVRLATDDEPAKEGRIYTVAVANGRYFGGGMMVAPDARVDDGRFDVVTLGDFSFADLLLRGRDIYTGKHLSSPKVTVTRAKRVVAAPVDPRAEVLLDVDGEALGRLPATFELLPRALKLKARL